MSRDLMAPEELPEILREALDESEHHADLEAANEAVNEALRSSDGYRFDSEAQEHLRAALGRLRQARELYRANKARNVIGRIEQGKNDRERAEEERNGR